MPADVWWLHSGFKGQISVLQGPLLRAQASLPLPQIVHSQVCVPAAEFIVRNSRMESRFEQTTAIHTFAEATSSVQVQDISEKVCRKGRISGK